MLMIHFLMQISLFLTPHFEQMIALLDPTKKGSMRELKMGLDFRVFWSKLGDLSLH